MGIPHAPTLTPGSKSLTNQELVLKLDMAEASRDELQARDERRRVAFETARSEAEESADGVRAAAAAREMELHAQLQAARHELSERHALAELATSRRRDEALRADAELKRALANARMLEERLSIERREHADALAEADGRTELLARCLESRERQTAEAAMLGEERGRELSGLADILQRSLAQVSHDSIADATLLETQTKELKIAAERRACKPLLVAAVSPTDAGEDGGEQPPAASPPLE